MKKVLLVFLAILVLVFIVLGIYGFVNNTDGTFFDLPTSYSGRTPAETATASAEPTASATASATASTEPTPDPRDDENVIRSEVAKMIQDTKDLIAEGLVDDASMMIRDLRTRELTKAEKEQVDKLQASMVKISD